MKTMILIAAMFCASHAAAVQIDWNNKDLVKQANDAVAVQMGLPAGSRAFAITVARAPKKAENATIVLTAKPVGDSYLIRPYGSGQTRTIGLSLNADMDRVGAEITICREPDSYDDKQTETLRFAFPELTVDAKNKRILLGSDVVATYSTGFLTRGVTVKKPYRLDFSAVITKKDFGFNRQKVEVYTVTLKRVEQKS